MKKASLFRDMKRRGEKITSLTAYDYFTTKIMDEVGVQLILVDEGDGGRSVASAAAVLRTVD